MESILLTINITLAVLLVVVILLQRSEGGALGLGVSQDNFTSSRSAGDFLTKFTSILAVFFIITSIALSFDFTCRDKRNSISYRFRKRKRSK